jgi:hypothetical protein
MSLDATAEQQAIITRLSTLCGGRVGTDEAEETLRVLDETTGLLKPFMVVTFGAVFVTGRDRSIEGEDQQPHTMPIIVECYASNRNAAGATAGAVRTRLTGFEPTDNSSEIGLGGGSWFVQRDSAGRPTLFAETVTGTTEINLSVLIP